MANDTQPIIIKKIKKGGHGHHGGAWKVAFADFVTAMMAFFMLMWLMGSTSKEQKQAIANYFENPLATDGASNSAIDMGGGFDVPTGVGPEEMEAYPEEGGEEPTFKAGLDYDDPARVEEEAERLEAERLETLREELEEAIEATESLARYRNQLLIDVTHEGLRIQIVDEAKRPMFALGSAELETHTRAILREISKVIAGVPNRISVAGHTDQRPYNGRRGYSNWELSADRANAARRELLAGGLPEEKVGRVVGLASSVLFDPEDPLNPVNRRISIIVMNRAAEQAVMDAEGAGGLDTERVEDPEARPAAGAATAAPSATPVAAAEDRG